MLSQKNKTSILWKKIHSPVYLNVIITPNIPFLIYNSDIMSFFVIIIKYLSALI